MQLLQLSGVQRGLFHIKEECQWIMAIKPLGKVEVPLGDPSRKIRSLREGGLVDNALEVADLAHALRQGGLARDIGLILQTNDD